MTSIQTITARSIINIFKNAASCDQTRPRLINVQVYKNSNQDEITLAATDGHKLVKLVINDDLLYSSLQSGLKYFINGDNIKRLEVEIKLNKKSTILQISQDIIQIDENSQLVNIEQYIPNDEGYDFEIGLNAEYLLQIAEAFKEQSKNCNVKLKFKRILKSDGTFDLDKLAPILVNVQDQVNVLMPVRI